MGRHAEGWKVLWRNGIAYVRFTHAGKRFFISTGQRDPERASSEAGRLYAHTVEGKFRKQRGVIRSLQPLDALFAEWLAWQEGILDPQTIATYKTTYVGQHFLTHFSTLGEVCDEEKVSDYIRTRLRVVLRSTLRKEMSALRSFVKWCKDHGAIGELPVWPELPAKAKGKRAGRQRAKANELSPAQVETLIAALPEWSERTTKKGRRFAVRARFRFAYETGLRPSTVSTLVWGDVKGTLLAVRDEIDKARFGREIPLSDAAIAALASIAEEPCRPETIIFGRHDYRTALEKACTKAGLDMKFAAYDLRHARGTHLVDAGAPLSAVAHLLGHRQLTTTNKYAKANLRAAEAAVRAVRPPLLLPPAPSPAPDDSGAVLDRLVEDFVRRTGVEPVQELPHWNLNPSTSPENSGNSAEIRVTRPGEEPQETAENRHEPDRKGAVHRYFGDREARLVRRYVAAEWTAAAFVGGAS